ncbi:MAG TPA: sugar phosphate isomerase/epimerase family protein [Pyrinomonadaceae bacterium]
MNKIGIMQGRLSPRPKDRLQAFPWKSWQDEFQNARDCGFDCIEWLFEEDNYTSNPIWTNEIKTIERLIEETGIAIRSVCADYFMPHPLFGAADVELDHRLEVLNQLIIKSARIGVEVILLPVLEISELRNEGDKSELLENLKRPLDLARQHRMKIGLETELPAGEYRDLILRADHEALGVYYDTGNAAAKGFDIASDLEILGPQICGIHIKDRQRGGVSVPLGTGNANFTGFFTKLAEFNYQGPIVLQTAFDKDPAGEAALQLNFVKDHLQPKLALG